MSDNYKKYKKLIKKKKKRKPKSQAQLKKKDQRDVRLHFHASLYGFDVEYSRNSDFRKKKKFFSARIDCV